MTDKKTGISGGGRIAPVAVVNPGKGAAGLTAVVCMLTLLLLFFAALPAEQAMAASCKLTFSSSSEEIRTDDVFIVELALEGEVVPGIFEGYISYNADVAEFVAGPECAAGGEGTIRISDLNYDATTLSRKYILYFKAVKTGGCEISMRGTPEIYETDSGNLMSVSSNKLSLEIKPSAKASSDASLAIMKVNPGTLSPEFAPSIHEYSMTVEYNATEIFVSASPNNVDATVKIEGNQNLDVGQNRILVFVTAEDGTVEKYVIYAVREAEGAETDDRTETEAQVTPAEAEDGVSVQTENDEHAAVPDDGQKISDGWAFFAGEDESGLYLVVDSRYRICDDEAGVTIPDGYSKSTVLVSGHNITAYYPSGNTESDFILMVLERDGGSSALYTFDRIEKTLQRVDREDIIGGNRTASGYSTIEEEELVKSYQKSLGTMTMVIAVLSGVCMLLLIITIRLAVRSRQELD